MGKFRLSELQYRWRNDTKVFMNDEKLRWSRLIFCTIALIGLIGLRQVHRGGAEVYLSSLRVNIAEESVVDHRVQLQCKFDEKEGKYTEAKPRCTCPSYESNLHQVGEVQHQLPLNLMLVHFRLHLCSGYTDQYHSCIRSRAQWSLNRMEAAEDIFRVGGIRPHESFGEDTYLQYLQHKYQHMNTFHKVIIPLNKIYIKLSGIV